MSINQLDIFSAPASPGGNAIDTLEPYRIKLNALFVDAIKNSATADAGYTFWRKSLEVTHSKTLTGTYRKTMETYAEELSDWLELNYPSKHWRPTGTLSREETRITGH